MIQNIREVSYAPRMDGNKGEHAGGQRCHYQGRHPGLAESDGELLALTEAEADGECDEADGGGLGGRSWR